ncbi:hypothetical protein PNH38_01270 [Anoxybacillus rupiensis]|jgi:uncharacterized membrane protein (Fun14 family)|uniref:Uncharacterized protein n=1 Tax=Anoxybacteroides rupiense TaxID=311460 RepID=A0ABD5ISK5_9BACL|nr:MULTISPECIES: hypothetical protein [Anoxybacillus]KXG11191.1 hypothetical protein AT864_00274 [Anoxybacillus sp. P3H1B]MBB3906769.1 putative membrane protein (Fun14 family) [Anoxybacillus rupiensis]MDE8562509.1 hypothetical protein [Anoxybacillus rupiensis]MED5050755.1 hypothetical protein [Anoxybacillus rupiensis]OQM45022.1 hypothetical protein B6A27_13370 [Anoxybacillus sp. UARK-01]
MKIRIEANGHRLILPLPMKVVLNDVTIRIIASCIKKYSNVPIKEEYLKVLRKELINAKMSFRKLVLLDVSSSDGFKIKITL